MPVCRYGGAKCQAGPGAAGDAETVHQHEITYHDKPNRYRGNKGTPPRLLSKEQRAALRQVSFPDPAFGYLLETRGRARRSGEVPKTASAKRKAADKKKGLKENNRDRD